MRKEAHNDEYYMRRALSLAEKAAKKDEVPVGAVIVRFGKIIATGYNKRERSGNPSSHAEFTAMLRAARKLKNWRLDDCTLYVTLEPCPMCAGLALNARLPRLVYGAADAKSGALGSAFDLTTGCNHTLNVTSGILKEECSEILKSYFRKKREKNKK